MQKHSNTPKIAKRHNRQKRNYLKIKHNTRERVKKGKSRR
jgi:hypothetical protein